MLPALLLSVALGAPAAGISTGFVPLGAAPLPAGEGSVVVNSGAMVAPVDFGFAWSAATAVASFAPHDRLAVAAWGGLGSEHGRTIGGLARVLVVNAPRARVAVVGGAHLLRVPDGRLDLPTPVIAGLAAELGGDVLRVDVSVGAPWIFDGGISMISRDDHHRLRAALSAGLPTLGYRYVGDRFVFGADVASVLVINAAWARFGVRFGSR